MRVDYDQIESRYDGRYVQNDYANVEATVRELVADAARILEVG